MNAHEQYIELLMPRLEAKLKRSLDREERLGFQRLSLMFLEVIGNDIERAETDKELEEITDFLSSQYHKFP